MFSKHQTSTTLLSFEQGNRATLPLSCSLCAVSTPTPKPRAEGSSPSAPAKSQVSLLRYLTFSLVCGRIWKRGAPAGSPAVRVVGACSPVGCVQARPRRQPRQVLLPLPKTGENTGFSPVFFLPVLHGNGVHFGSNSGFSHPFAPALTVLIPSSTQNAPGFAFFGLFLGALFCFPLFLGCKFSGCFYVSCLIVATN